jgi:RMKL-like, methyltransferase domain
MPAKSLKARITGFQEELPYRAEPFSSRGWGHNLHSLCSYQGKLKPSIAHWLIGRFVPKGGRVLDPLGGVGTIAFEAALSGRQAISNDKSPFAAAVARAKLDPPSMEEALAALRSVEDRLQQVTLNADDHQAAEFGLNAAVADYYHPKTLEEVLKARKVFKHDPGTERGRNFVWACLLHVLHGNRPYALSRRSHSITPFNPTGKREYRGVIEHTERKLRRALNDGLPKSFVPGEALQVDFRDLPRLADQRFSAIITSPPFAGMRFDRPNWLRLWFCGWGEREFRLASQSFLEREQLASWDCYQDFFEICKKLLAPRGLLVLHLGSGGSDDMVERLKGLAAEDFVTKGEVTEMLGASERHGLRDKGRTNTHHYFFLQPKAATKATAVSLS